MPRTGRCDSGQVMVFMLMALLILSFMLIWLFDLHKTVATKWRTQNAGDAAALAAARWQGISLNLIGDLNLMQAVALTTGDTNAAIQINGLQQRLAFHGPLIGLMAAQQAAKNNHIFVHPPFSEELNDQAGEILNDYIHIFPEPYPGCWSEVGDTVAFIAGQGVAAAPDNTRRYTDFSGGHWLLTPDFYDAVAGQDWCWFLWHAMTLLESYTDFHDWPPLPPPVTEPNPENSEIFGLGLVAQTTELPGGVAAISLMNELTAGRALSETVISNSVAALTVNWFCYSPSVWGPWSLIARTGDDPFPAAGDVKPEFDYAGADVAIRIVAGITRLTPGIPGSAITWTAAAKPFGWLDDGGAPVKPNLYGLVLPAFHEVRLIPVDASSAPAAGAYDMAWQDHIENHLSDYMADGLSALASDCLYCQQLVVWENPLVRNGALDYIGATNASGQRIHCQVGGGGGTSPGGGRRRGH
ncbi:MAG: hypothetical protein HY343_01855 [Lentisphaerae bacterium]|nr:hypothetical protein [Lentisphaerota bacterium]